VDPAPATVAKAAKEPAAPQSAPAKLRESLTAPYPNRSLPVLLSADYYDIADKGPVVSTAIQMPGEFLVFGEQPDGKIQAIVDLSGIFLDEKGVVKTSFMERIVTTAPNLEATKNNREFTRCESRRVTIRAARSEARMRGSRYRIWRRRS
jgi:hypothetical protein